MVPEIEGLLQQDVDACHEVAQHILQSEADGEAGHSQRGDNSGQLEVEDRQDGRNPQGDEPHVQEVRDQGRYRPILCSERPRDRNPPPHAPCKG